MTNTAVGELAVQVGLRRWLFRPSLLAMAGIGSPQQIVETFAAVHGGFSRMAFDAAVRVMWACSEDGDASELTGYVRTYGRWVPGKIPPEDILLLARSLMTHGVTGAVKPDKPAAGAGNYTPEFKASESAALAIAHLGMSESDAWSMTMTGLVLALRAKYHDGKPSVDRVADEADETMDWLKRVNAMRDGHASR